MQEPYFEISDLIRNLRKENIDYIDFIILAKKLALKYKKICVNCPNIKKLNK